MTTITVHFPILYVFVVLDGGTRRIMHWNVTEHPTADWTIQQCRTAITGETAHRFLIHDRTRSTRQPWTVRSDRWGCAC